MRSISVLGLLMLFSSAVLAQEPPASPSSEPVQPPAAAPEPAAPTAQPAAVTGSPADSTAASAAVEPRTAPAPVEPPAPATTALPPASSPAPAAAPLGTVTLGPKGFNAQTEDGRFALNIRFPFMFDAKATISEEQPLNGDAFYPRFFGPIISGTLFKNVTGRLIVGFQDRSVGVVNAWLDLAITSWLHLRVGKILSPLSLERATLPLRITLLEHGLASTLLPVSEFGVTLWGASDDKLIEYTAMLSNGAIANAHYEVDQDPGKDLIGRVFVKPFVRTGIPALAGFGLGFGASYGVHTGTVANPLTGNARTLGGRVFFSTIANAMDPTVNTYADGRITRLVPQASYVAGPLALYAEYIRTTERLRAGDRRADVTNSAYHAVAAVVLTGENAVLLDVLSPKKPFNWDEGQFGAFEVVARAEHIDYDKDLFPRFANPAASAKSATALGGGFNWIPTDGVRLMVNYEYTKFGAAQGAAKLRPEHLLGLRLQALF